MARAFNAAEGLLEWTPYRRAREASFAVESGSKLPHSTLTLPSASRPYFDRFMNGTNIGVRRLYSL